MRPGDQHLWQAQPRAHAQAKRQADHRFKKGFHIIPPTSKPAPYDGDAPASAADPASLPRHC
jgi:hypothetical protein